MSVASISRAWKQFPITASQWLDATHGPVLDVRGMVMGSIFTDVAAPSWTFFAASGFSDNGEHPPDTGNMRGADGLALPTMTFTAGGWTAIPWEFFQFPFIHIHGSSTANRTLVFLNG